MSEAAKAAAIKRSSSGSKPACKQSIYFCIFYDNNLFIPIIHKLYAFFDVIIVFLASKNLKLKLEKLF